MESSNHEMYIARFERIERLLEALANGQTQLLKSQVFLTGEVAKIAGAQVKLTESQLAIAEALNELAAAQTESGKAHAQLEEAQARTELKSLETQEKLDALIQIWDEWIRERRAREGGEPPVQ